MKIVEKTQPEAVPAIKYSLFLYCFALLHISFSYFMIMNFKRSVQASHVLAFRCHKHSYINVCETMDAYCFQ